MCRTCRFALVSPRRSRRPARACSSRPRSPAACATCCSGSSTATGGRSPVTWPGCSSTGWRRPGERVDVVTWAPTSAAAPARARLRPGRARRPAGRPAARRAVPAAARARRAAPARRPGADRAGRLARAGVPGAPARARRAGCSSSTTSSRPGRRCGPRPRRCEPPAPSTWCRPPFAATPGRAAGRCTRRVTRPGASARDPGPTRRPTAYGSGHVRRAPAATSVRSGAAGGRRATSAGAAAFAAAAARRRPGRSARRARVPPPPPGAVPPPSGRRAAAPAGRAGGRRRRAADC